MVKAPSAHDSCWLILAFLTVCAASPATSQVPRKPLYLWPTARQGEPLESRIPPPEGFRRIEAGKDTFAAWLRGLPLFSGRPAVHLYDGSPKGNQDAHHAVVAIDAGHEDLQQCADAIIRLRAEYLLAAGCEERVAFHFTSGDLASWPRWRSGERPKVSRNRVTWSKTAAPDSGYQNFRKYLDSVFNYAGSASVQKELERVHNPGKIEIGDVFIKGGFPGHAVLVLDVVERTDGGRMFLLAQSYMPAQEIHVLRNPASSGSPWYPAGMTGPLITPEWTFEYTDLMRFPARDCAVLPVR